MVWTMPHPTDGISDRGQLSALNPLKFAKCLASIIAVRIVCLTVPDTIYRIVFITSSRALVFWVARHLENAGKAGFGSHVLGCVGLTHGE